MRKSIVYTVTRKSTGEQYIGCTKGTILRRKHNHATEAKRGKSGKFMDALRADGVDGFTWIVVQEFEVHDQALGFERALIRERNTVERGLNTYPGGAANGGRKRTAEEKVWLSRQAADRTRNAEYSAAISGKLQSFYATAAGQEQLARRKEIANRPDVRAAMSRAHGGRPIEAFKDGVVVAVYATQGECAKALGTSQGNVSNCVLGRPGSRSVRGFILRFAGTGTSVPSNPPC